MLKILAVAKAMPRHPVRERFPHLGVLPWPPVRLRGSLAQRIVMASRPLTRSFNQCIGVPPIGFRRSLTQRIVRGPPIGFRRSLTWSTVYRLSPFNHSAYCHTLPSGFVRSLSGSFVHLSGSLVRPSGSFIHPEGSLVRLAKKYFAIWPNLFIQHSVHFYKLFNYHLVCNL